MDISHEQNVNFGQTWESRADIPYDLREMQMDGSANVELGNFLERPRLIQTYTWNVNTLFDESFSPWLNYFDDPTVKSKLDHYAFMRCNLKLRFVINSSPFYYSSIMVTYRPLSNRETFDAYEPCPVNGGLGLEQQELLGRSQRPKCFLYPQDSLGATMDLPFFWPKNWLDVTDRKDLIDMGTINMDSLFFPLTSANSTVGTGVTVQVYAWATDVDLAGPTVSVSIQSKDEYGDGPISKPASAIARYSRQLESIPIISPFATATTMAASTVGYIANLFGYTNVPVIEDSKPMVPKNNPNYAATDIGMPVEKLTLDCKNELTIDPKVCGLDVGDELEISSIVTRESFIGTYMWQSTDPVDTLLFNSYVTPCIYDARTISGIKYVQGTPSWMVSRMFEYWRGDMIFKFKFLCSQYHRGRVKISWDPVGDIANTSESTNLVYTKIVDITNETEVEFSIPYTQVTSYLRTVRFFTTTFYDTAPLSPGAFSNGVITVRVLTNQSSPVSNAEIGVAVFVRGHENIEFACPISIENGGMLTSYNIQSQDINYGSTTVSDMGMVASSASPYINLVHMGETIKSLRTLLRRTYLHRLIEIVRDNVAGNVITQCTFPRMPYFLGYQTDGLDEAKSLIGPGAYRFNYVHDTPINWISSCFVGHRGSVIWHADVNESANSKLASVYLERAEKVLTASNQYIQDANSFITVSSAPFTGFLLGDHAAGVAVGDNKYQHSTHASIPYYNSFKFSSNNRNYRTLGNTVDNSKDDSVVLSTFSSPSVGNSANRMFVKLHCSVGTDYSPIWFLNVPGYIELQSVPIPSNV